MKPKKPIKVRRTWSINPRERIRTDKEELDPCEECGAYKSSPAICTECEYG